MYETTYLRASTLEEAVAWLREHDEARPLSGGMTLIPTLKQRLAAPSHLIDLTRIEAMRGIAIVAHPHFEQTAVGRQIPGRG